MVSREKNLHALESNDFNCTSALVSLVMVGTLYSLKLGFLTYKIRIKNILSWEPTERVPNDLSWNNLSTKIKYWIITQSIKLIFMSP